MATAESPGTQALPGYSDEGGGRDPRIEIPTVAAPTATGSDSARGPTAKPATMIRRIAATFTTVNPVCTALPCRTPT